MSSWFVYQFHAPTPLVELAGLLESLACEYHLWLHTLHTECHATGTYVGDVIELDAIGAFYGAAHEADRPVRLATLKSNIGHAEVAAGIFSVIKVRNAVCVDQTSCMGPFTEN